MEPLPRPMIYLKISVLRQPGQLDACSRSQEGTAEFMFRDFDPQSAGRLATALLKADGWQFMDIIKAVEGDYPADFDGFEHGERLFREAQTDDIAYEITEAIPARENSRLQGVA